MSLATETRGGAVHWNGPPMGLGDCTGDRCLAAWESIRRFHVNTRGWRDIAYNHGVCPGCGRLLEGRGWGVRSAANGTNVANSRWHAWMVLQGEGEVPTDVAKRTLLALHAEHRRRYGRSVLTTHHAVRDGTTECPGRLWRAWVDAGAPSATTPAPSEDDDMTPEQDALLRQMAVDAKYARDKASTAVSALGRIEKQLAGRDVAGDLQATRGLLESIAGGPSWSGSNLNAEVDEIRRNVRPEQETY